jgi:hypothetical protein
MFCFHMPPLLHGKYLYADTHLRPCAVLCPPFVRRNSVMCRQVWQIRACHGSKSLRNSGDWSITSKSGYMTYSQNLLFSKCDHLTLLHTKHVSFLQLYSDASTLQKRANKTRRQKQHTILLCKGAAFTATKQNWASKPLIHAAVQE